jgi:hypothetical protein
MKIEVVLFVSEMNEVCNSQIFNNILFVSEIDKYIFLHGDSFYLTRKWKYDIHI